MQQAVSLEATVSVVFKLADHLCSNVLDQGWSGCEDKLSM